VACFAECVDVERHLRSTLPPNPLLCSQSRWSLHLLTHHLHAPVALQVPILIMSYVQQAPSRPAPTAGPIRSLKRSFSSTTASTSTSTGTSMSAHIMTQKLPDSAYGQSPSVPSTSVSIVSHGLCYPKHVVRKGDRASSHRHDTDLTWCCCS